MRVALIIGTRPEAIKLAPIHDELLRRDHDVDILLTGQHTELILPLLKLFSMEGHCSRIHLDSIDGAVSPYSERLAAYIRGVQRHLEGQLVDCLIVQGDTLSALAGALAGFFSRTCLVHIEAGLRSGQRLSPWPEEVNRQLVGVLADHHFAPREEDADNLAVDRDRISVVGNTAIDALSWALQRIASHKDRYRHPFEDLVTPAARLLVMTVHRSENRCDRMEVVIRAVARVLADDSNAVAVWPVHPHPGVSAYAPLADRLGIHTCPALEYPVFLRLLQAAEVVVTDSGGVQEECCYLGKKLVVCRDATERNSQVTGAIVVPPTSEQDVSAAIREALELTTVQSDCHGFGTGNSAMQIVNRLPAIVSRHADEIQQFTSAARTSV